MIVHADVRKRHDGSPRPWTTDAWEVADKRTGRMRRARSHRFPTHAAALAHALAEVGLDRPAEHREAP